MTMADVHFDPRVCGGSLLTVCLAGLVFLVGCATASRPDGAPAAQSALLGADAILEGNVEVLVEDSNGGSRILYFLLTDRRVPLRFANRPNLTTGAHVRVRGRWQPEGEFEVTALEVSEP